MGPMETVKALEFVRQQERRANEAMQEFIAACRAAAVEGKTTQLLWPLTLEYGESTEINKVVRILISPQ